MRTQLRALVLGTALLVGSSLGFSQTIMEMGTITASPGASLVATIFLTHNDPIQAFQTAVTYSNEVFTLNDMSTSGLDLETEDAQAAPARPGHAVDHAQGRGLAGAVGPEQAEADSLPDA